MKEKCNIYETINISLLSISYVIEVHLIQSALLGLKI